MANSGSGGGASASGQITAQQAALDRELAHQMMMSGEGGADNPSGSGMGGSNSAAGAGSNVSGNLAASMQHN